MLDSHGIDTAIQNRHASISVFLSMSLVNTQVESIKFLPGFYPASEFTDSHLQNRYHTEEIRMQVSFSGSTQFKKPLNNQNQARNNVYPVTPDSVSIQPALTGLL
jgi:hypothetical protein